MESDEDTVRFLLAIADFETAWNLSKTDKKIRYNKTIIQYYVNTFDLHYSIISTSMFEVYRLLINNLFTANVPLNTQITFTPSKYTLPAALTIAKITNNTDFIQHYSIPEKEEEFMDTLERLFRYHCLCFINDLSSFHISDYFYYGYFLVKSWMWDKFYQDIPPSYFQMNAFRNLIYDAVLQTKIKRVLENPPEELTSMPNWNKEKFLQSIVTRNSFPFNLYTKRQVAFFEKEIKSLGFKEIRQRILQYPHVILHTYAPLKAISDLFGKQFSIFPNSKIFIQFDKSTTPHKEVKIMKFLGYSNISKYLLNIINTRSCPDDKFLYYVREYLNQGYQRKYITKAYRKYLKVYPDNFPIV